MEIEEGEFVRTKSNGIKKVDIIFENKYGGIIECYK